MNLYWIIIFAINLFCISSNASIRETIVLKESNSAPGILANLSKIVYEKSSSKIENINSLAIQAYDVQRIRPFYVESGRYLKISTRIIDRESICMEESNRLPLQLINECNEDECCKLLQLYYGEMNYLFVLVKVQDVNDVIPYFLKIDRPYRKLSENIMKGTVIDLPEAYDEDSKKFSVQSYEIKRPFIKGRDGDFQFRIENHKPKLIVNGLDYEKCVSYEFEMMAYDYDRRDKNANGNTGIIVIEIQVFDENDNVPKFQQEKYVVEIKENIRKDKLIEFQVMDGDSGPNGRINVMLECDHKDLVNKFLVGPISYDNKGWVSLVNFLDYEKDPKNFEVRLIVSDNGLKKKLSSSALMQVIVLNVNDNPPRIELDRRDAGKYTLAENAATRSLVALIMVYDADTNLDQIQCKLLSHANLFHLEPKNQHELLTFKPFTLRSSAVINREDPQGGYLRVTIECTDGESSRPLTSRETLTVEILDVNDNPPMFTRKQYEGSVVENRAHASVTFREPILAQDPDVGSSGVAYSMAGNDSSYFLVDGKTGLISTRTELDYESRDLYQFFVVARDTTPSGPDSYEASATVVVRVQDENDWRPTFAQMAYVFQVREDAPLNTRVGQVKAADKDTLPHNKQVFYKFDPSSLIPPGTRLPVQINRDTGWISTRHNIDYETLSSFSITVVAYNKVPLASSSTNSDTFVSQAAVTINVININDNKPQFTAINSPHSFRLEFQVMPSSSEPGSSSQANCQPIPYSVQDLDHPSSGEQTLVSTSCCTLSLKDDYQGLFSLSEHPPSLCITHNTKLLTHMPGSIVSKTVTLVATDKSTSELDDVRHTTKVSFPVWIRRGTTVGARQVPGGGQDNYGNQRYPSGGRSVDGEDGRRSNGNDVGQGGGFNGLQQRDNKTFIIVLILVTVVMVFIAVVIVIFFLFRRCSDNQPEYESAGSIAGTGPHHHLSPSVKVLNTLHQSDNTLHHQTTTTASLLNAQMMMLHGNGNAATTPDSVVKQHHHHHLTSQYNLYERASCGLGTTATPPSPGGRGDRITYHPLIPNLRGPGSPPVLSSTPLNSTTSHDPCNIYQDWSPHYQTLGKPLAMTSPSNPPPSSQTNIIYNDLHDPQQQGQPTSSFMYYPTHSTSNTPSIAHKQKLNPSTTMPRSNNINYFQTTFV